MATSATAGGPGAHGKPARAYGLCYGTKTSQPLRPGEVVEKYKGHGITKMGLSPTPLTKNDNVIPIPPIVPGEMKIVLCIDYNDLSPLANDASASNWINTYVASNASVISHVCVGDVIGSVDFSLHDFKDAMSNLKNSLPDTIKLSVLVNESMLLGHAYTALDPPSTCIIEPSRSKDILLFLSKLTRYPIQLFVRIMPYFMISKGLAVENCILRDTAQTYMKDMVNGVNYSYSQAFDAMLDSICCALKKVDELGEVDIHVVTGWPTGPFSAPDASEQRAREYFSNLLPRIGKPTPMHNNPVDVFIYSLVDEENLETNVKEFKHLGAEKYLPCG
ncbi:glucan endo-1,3-beta-glucosidase GII precursor,putative, expressed [Cinnamomum micranthum f. kanehirae]|uniref:Glucan endo-1,3-beta-glucosidase GII,putative, expressed n=1 Tax=Cinnamomum micranthum f. kanehirae TaxID=337451 RepID=A0A3S3N1Y2_9MAGN|nr:glucan endo-1,3-beta-glucosidase GII precursor,putative, expressed [Cinnamomum micranthum f. kanehirae]